MYRKYDCDTFFAVKRFLLARNTIFFSSIASSGCIVFTSLSNGRSDIQRSVRSLSCNWLYWTDIFNVIITRMPTTATIVNRGNSAVSVTRYTGDCRCTSYTNPSELCWFLFKTRCTLSEMSTLEMRGILIAVTLINAR